MAAILVDSSWAFPAQTRVTFCPDKKGPKNRLRGRGFRLPLPLKNSPPATTQKGAPAPFWISPHEKGPVLNFYEYSRDCVTRTMFR